MGRRQALTALRATPLEHLLSVLGRHTHQKAVRFLPATVVRLERALSLSHSCVLANQRFYTTILRRLRVLQSSVHPQLTKCVLAPPSSGTILTKDSGGNRPAEFSTTVEKLVEKATNLNRVARKRRFLQDLLQAKTCQAPYTRRLHTVATGKTRLLRAAENAPVVGRT